LEYVNLIWTNSAGGVDAYQFLAPQEGNNHTRIQMKRNIYGVDQDGFYSDKNGDIYNPSDVVLSNKFSRNIKLTSKELTNDEAYWMAELFATKQLYVELSDGSLLPALINGTNYDIKRPRYNRGALNTIQVEITLSEGGDSSYILTP
jgi:hypothetical protein